MIVDKIVYNSVNVKQDFMRSAMGNTIRMYPTGGRIRDSAWRTGVLASLESWWLESPLAVCFGRILSAILDFIVTERIRKVRIDMERACG
jgi:hypothetical protein